MGYPANHAIPLEHCFPHSQPQLKRAAYASFASREPPPSHSSIKRHREGGRESSYRARSISPMHPEPSRKCLRSCSPHQVDDSPPRRRAEKSSRDNTGRSKRDKGEFFPSGTGPRGGVCAVCLGHHDHPFGRCKARKLWDGSGETARKGESGRLISPSGFPLCFNWQLPTGCQSTTHPERHKCSGCGKAGHRAQTCPRAQKA